MSKIGREGSGEMNECEEQEYGTGNVWPGTL